MTLKWPDCLLNMTYSGLTVYWIWRTVAWLFTEYDLARGILKFQCKTWEFHATSYSVKSQAIIARGILKFQCKAWEFRAASVSVNSQAIIVFLSVWIYISPALPVQYIKKTLNFSLNLPTFFYYFKIHVSHFDRKFPHYYELFPSHALVYIEIH